MAVSMSRVLGSGMSNNIIDRISNMDEIEKKAREIYSKESGNHPTIHANRMPIWEELSLPERDRYRNMAIVATGGFNTVEEVKIWDKPIEIQWDLYKRGSGKWAYGGVVSISGKNRIFEREALICEIDELQNEVTAGILPRCCSQGVSDYILSIRETDAQHDNPEYHGHFFRCLYV